MGGRGSQESVAAVNQGWKWKCSGVGCSYVNEEKPEKSQLEFRTEASLVRDS